MLTFAPNIRFRVDFWGPEAAGGHSRIPGRNGDKVSISPPAARVRAHYAIVYPAGFCYDPVAMLGFVDLATELAEDDHGERATRKGLISAYGPTVGEQMWSSAANIY